MQTIKGCMVKPPPLASSADQIQNNFFIMHHRTLFEVRHHIFLHFIIVDLQQPTVAMPLLAQVISLRNGIHKSWSAVTAEAIIRGAMPFEGRALGYNS